MLLAAILPLGRMAASCICTWCSIYIWLLMFLSVTAQCEDPGIDILGFSLVASDIGGKVVNLDLECNKAEVKFNMSSGGIYVNWVNIFQECVGYNISSELTSSGDSHITTIFIDNFPTRMDEREETVAPNPTTLSDVACAYYGCYSADRFSHGLPYILTFTAANKCTFTQEMKQGLIIATASSSLSQHTTTVMTSTKDSMSSVTLAYHTPIQRTMATMAGMQQSSTSALQLQATPITSANVEITLISKSPDPTALILTTVTGGNGNILPWVIIAILFPVVLSVVLVFVGICLVLRRIDTVRHEKGKFPYENHTEWTKYHNAEEPIDETFFPVLVDIRPKSPSSHSMKTILDELEYCSTTPGHSTSCTLAPTQPSDAPTCTRNNNVSSLLDIVQSSDTDCEEHLNLRKEWHSFHSIRLSLGQKAMHLSETQLPDPMANVYNYSLDSREYVQVSSLSYSDGGSTTVTALTLDQRQEDSRVQRLNDDDHTDDDI